MFEIKMTDIHLKSIEEFKKACRDMGERLMVMGGEKPSETILPCDKFGNYMSPETKNSIPRTITDTQKDALLSIFSPNFGKSEAGYVNSPVFNITPTDPNFTPGSPGVSNDCDSQGQLWNPEIHSRTKSRNSDGTWKVKRGSTITPPPVFGVSDPTIFSAPPIPSVPVPPVLASHKEIPVPMVEGNWDDEVDTLEVSSETVDFPAFMTKITLARSSGSLPPDSPARLARELGITSVADLAHRSDLIPAAMDKLAQMVGG